MSIRIARIVSGGQTGADRAALDVAVRLGLEYGGWCPLGGCAEDLPEPPGLLRSYPSLREAPSADPDVRTRLNVRDSHATLIVRSAGVASSGTDLTETHARVLGRPCFVASADEILEAAAWLAHQPAEITLNVAGPRESEQPGSYASTERLLRALLRAPEAAR